PKAAARPIETLLAQPRTSASYYQRHARDEQEHKYALAERSFIELAVELPADPGTDGECRQSDREQLEHIRGDDARSPEHNKRDQKGGNAGGLKGSSLFVARPSAHVAPDDDQDTGEPGRSADHPIEEARPRVRGLAASLHLRQLRPGEIVEAEQDQQGADRHAKIGRRHP